MTLKFSTAFAVVEADVHVRAKFAQTEFRGS